MGREFNRMDDRWIDTLSSTNICKIYIFFPRYNTPWKLDCAEISLSKKAVDKEIIKGNKLNSCPGYCQEIKFSTMKFNSSNAIFTPNIEKIGDHTPRVFLARLILTLIYNDKIKTVLQYLQCYHSNTKLRISGVHQKLWYNQGH